MDDRKRLTNIVGGSAGNLVEWFDWYVYAAFALYFAPSFFPKGDQTAQLLQTAAIFAVGFVVRPIGAWLMGIYADHKGRKAGLTLSVSLMCAASLLIAVAPTYAQAGLLSPAVLLIARLLQGISLGGEYGSSATYLSEIADRERRGFWSSFQYVTIIGGQLTALALLVLLQALLGEQAMQDWGWRLGFLAGAVLAIVVFFIRRSLDETLSFSNVKAKGDRPKSTARNLFKEHPRQAFLVMALTAGGTASFYAYTIYLQKFLANTSGFDKATASQLMTVALAIMVGHLYPVWLKFQGGKGVATLLGVIAPLLWWPGPAVYALVWLGLLLIVRISSVAGIVAAATPPLTAVVIGKHEYFPLLLGFALLVLWKHRPNIGRLFAGTEPKIGRDKS